MNNTIVLKRMDLIEEKLDNLISHQKKSKKKSKSKMKKNMICVHTLISGIKIDIELLPIKFIDFVKNISSKFLSSVNYHIPIHNKTTIVVTGVPYTLSKYGDTFITQDMINKMLAAKVIHIYNKLS